MNYWKNKDIRFRVLDRDNYQCQVCDKTPSAQVHHIIPRSKGGRDELSNLITLCDKCHMLVSPVPDRLISGLWKIPQDKVKFGRAKVRNTIEKEQLHLQKPKLPHKTYSIKQIRCEYSKAYTKWTEEEGIRLKNEWDQGKTIKELAEIFKENQVLFAPVYKD